MAVLQGSCFTVARSDFWREMGSEFMAPLTAAPRSPEIIITDSLLVGEDDNNGLIKEEDFKNAGTGKNLLGV